MALFREEALQTQTAQYLGTIRIGRPPSFAVVTTTALLLGSALIAFATWGQVTRKARLPGILAPLLGTLQITSPQAGVVSELRVKDGDEVSEGQVLMVVGIDRNAGQGSTGALIAQALLARRTTLETELRLADQQARQRQAALTERLRSLEAERRQADGELEAAQSRVALTAKSLERFQQLVKEGFVSELQLQAKQEEWLDASSRARNAQRSLSALSRDAQSLLAEQAANATQLQTQRAQIERSLAALEQEGRENDARRQVVIMSSRAGVVSGLTAHAGQSVAAGQTLATVVPRAEGTSGPATLEAQLYAPSRTAGFVRSGQQVWLRYAAYPYQKFGMAQGEVAGISATPINPQDLPAGQAQALIQAAKSSEPLYRVRVKLAQQSIQTYGQSQPLKPGMALDADVLQDRRAVWEWVLEPVLAASSAVKVLSANPNKASPGG